MNKNSKKIYTIIGDPVEHSLSPVIHNAGYKALGIEDLYEFTAEKVKTEDLEDFIQKMREGKIAGASCTIPHKENIIPYLDELSETARSIGAVNTMIGNDGVLRGDNTDWIGAVEPLVKIRDLQGLNVAVIGAGGAGRAFVYGLVNAGCKVTIYNRTLEKAKTLAVHLGCEFRSLDDQDGIKNSDIICNSTSIGMDSDETPIDKSILHKGQIVFDAVYSPLKTRLLKEAEEVGAQTIPGTEMLLNQALAQFKLFTGRGAPEEAMRQALAEALK